ncbi:Mgm101p [Rhodotorula paludigena]|uniref:Mgm101p n=1 Tax=Rhodotorula paludigena TaxID=86838 RepID=UPI0031826FC9
MLSRAAQGLAQAAPARARTAATAAVKRPAFVPRARTASSPATSTAARSAPAAAVKAAQPVAAGSSTVAPPVKSVAPEPFTFDVLDAAGGPPGAPLEPPALDAEPASSSFVRSTPHNPFAASTSLPAGSAADWAPAPTTGTAATTPDVDWSTSFHGMSAQPYSREQAEILMRPLEAHEIEIKPDGLLYLPEILYRRILNKAFGPGGWGMVPRGEMTVLKNLVTREWGLVAGGRLVSVARGEQQFFDPSGMPTATEGCKSNALMRCCKDLGIASELWDPVFIRAFKKQHCIEAWTEHVTTKKKQKRWRKKGLSFEYPYSEAAR